MTLPILESLKTAHVVAVVDVAVRPGFPGPPEASPQKDWTATGGEESWDLGVDAQASTGSPAPRGPLDVILPYNGSGSPAAGKQCARTIIDPWTSQSRDVRPERAC